MTNAAGQLVIDQAVGLHEGQCGDRPQWLSPRAFSAADRTVDSAVDAALNMGNPPWAVRMVWISAQPTKDQFQPEKPPGS